MHDIDTPQYRPAYHFTPAAHWMNDPNGLLFHDGIYHLFFQHHPQGLNWGPMHWGHATSRDLLSWQEHAIALAPDALGMIFSGSAVIDRDNTCGLGRDGIAPWVAVFTHHDDEAARRGSERIESQSLAISLDQGRSWRKHAGNPVLPNPGLRDFRDPKVIWLEGRSRWLMSLAAHDHVRFYSSPDLQQWTLESEFGRERAVPGTVWECPDLFPLPWQGGTRWVLLVSVVPGGPNGGSGTMFFTGEFDGCRFVPDDVSVRAPIRWLDHGPDHYAGVTWSTSGTRRTLIGWMSNWDYAKSVPTSPWRSAMTLPRDLSLREVDGQPWLASAPAQETLRQGWQALAAPAAPAAGPIDLSAAWCRAAGRLTLALHLEGAAGFELVLGNAVGDELRLGFDTAAGEYFVDRRHAGRNDFSDRFAGRHVAPRLVQREGADVQLYFDATSMELFADGGLTTMTSLFFPREPYTRAALHLSSGARVHSLLLSAWAGAAQAQRRAA
jgi:fructan beta-fructosidase